MAGLEDGQESEVATIFDLSNLLVAKKEGSKFDLVEIVLAAPLEHLSPGVVSEPVADKVGIASVDKDGDLSEKVDDEPVEWKHPVTVKQEVPVDVEVARLVRRNLGAEGLDDFRLVQVVGDPAKLGVAQVGGILARAADIVNVDSRALIRTDHGVVAVDGGRDTRPHRLALVAALNETGTPGVGSIHSVALRLAQDGRVSTITASHGAVVLVLSKPIGQTVSDGDRLQVDVAVLVRKNLGGELRNVVAAIG